MADDSYTTEEEWTALSDGHKVYRKVWKPKVAPVAVLLLLHGFSDHINNQYTLLPTLTAHRIQCYGFDQRGFGKSVQKPAQKGLTGDTATVLDDITFILKTVIPIAEELQVPLFLMGHSMGGNECLMYSVKGPADVRSHIRGYIAEAPYIALHPAQQPHRLTVIGARALGKIAPKTHMVRAMSPKLISRDAKVAEDYTNDPLCHDTGTLEGLANLLDRAAELDSGAAIPTVGSFLIAHGDQDSICSYDASKKFFERLKVEDKEFKSYPGWFHKLHAEPGEDKTKFTNELAEWIIARSGQASEKRESKL